MTEKDDAIDAMWRNGQKLLLEVFADRYKQEVTAEEDIFRTLPFFATALGVDVAAGAYVANRLPHWDVIIDHPAAIGATACLALILLLGMGVIACLGRATWDVEYYRPGTEEEWVTLLDGAFQRLKRKEGVGEEALADELRTGLVGAYMRILPDNRMANRRRQRYRALAALLLLSSLMFALVATTTIFVADKFWNLPEVLP